MSISSSNGSNAGPGPGNTSSGPTSPAGVYGRGDLQAAFNWLVNQPEHIRKQASDPDRLMTLYYRSSGRPEMVRVTRDENQNPTSRIEIEAPVSGQTFISDLRQINEALRQFDGPTAQASIHTPLPAPQPIHHSQSSAQANGHSNNHVSGHSSGHSSAHANGNPAGAASSQFSQATEPFFNPANPAVKTQALLSEVREKLNLSSDAEALNVLVSLGYRSLKPLLG
jgi:hypothetical protein